MMEKLKAGIEIHQQLDVGKLFCNCDSDLRQDEPDIIVKRRLYAVAGESGKVDAAAAYEESKKRLYIYEGYSDGTCEVEFDESPPREMNEEALKVGLQVALLLNAKPFSVTQVMRKIVVDGSNTSGFQRTVVIARDGWIKINGKKIGIDFIGLEEDAGRRVAETKSSVTYRLDRLGIPLLEVGTAPDISSAEEAKEVALKIGDILRAVKVRRGIGTIRQDVNVSVPGGARTELKGVQEPSLIVKSINWEADRQRGLVKKKQKVVSAVRNAKPDGSNKYLRPMPGAERMYPETDIPLVRISKEMIEDVRKNLPKLRSDIINGLKKKGVSEEFAKMLVKERRVEAFEALLKTKVDVNLIAKSLVLFPKDIAGKQGFSIEGVCNRLNPEILEKVFNYVKLGNVSESAVRQVLETYVKEKDLVKAIKSASVKKTSSSTLKTEIQKVLKSKPGLTQGGYMGLLMGKLKGKAEPSEIARLLKELM
ncbi:hypothetical protein ACFLZZ_02430 [Nanoarchaeota archaeon]